MVEAELGLATPAKRCNDVSPALPVEAENGTSITPSRPESLAWVQGYLAHKNPLSVGPYSNLMARVQGGVLGGWLFSYWQGAPLSARRRGNHPWEGFPTFLWG